MPARPDPKPYDHSLLAATDARRAMLEKMRGKLAAPSQASLAMAEKRRKAERGKVIGLGFRILLILSFLGANAVIFGFREEIAGVVKVRRAPTVGNPKSLGLNDQALYWTYALYDFDRLKASYGAPANAVVDAAMARRKLEELMPKVDERTRFIIRRYMPGNGRSA